jgi:hypothetical protein
MKSGNLDSGKGFQFKADFKFRISLVGKANYEEEEAWRWNDRGSIDPVGGRLTPDLTFD